MCIRIVLRLPECTRMSSSRFRRHVHRDVYVAGLCAWAVSACARVPFCKHLHIPCAYSCMCMCLWGQPSKVDGALEMDSRMCTKTLCSLHQAA